MTKQAITKEWEQSTLGEVCDIYTGKKDVNEGSLDGKYPFFTCSKDISRSDSYSFDTEAILVAGNGVVGDTKYYNGKFEAYQRTYVLSDFKVNANFLYLYLSGILKRELAKSVVGSTMPYIKRGNLENITVPVPSLPEQKAIAQTLMTVQNTIAEQERLIAKLKKLKRSMMQHLFTHGTNNEQSKMTDIGEMPESWELITVKDAIERSIIEKPIDGNHGNIHPKSKDFVSEGIPFIMASNLVGNKVDIKHCHFLSKVQADKLQKGFSHEGDILLSHKATIGRTAIVHDLTTEYIMLTPQVTYYRVRDDKKLLNYFLRHFFDSNNFQKKLKRIAGDGSTRAYIGILKQQILPILLPLMSEQKKITEVLDALDSRIDAVQQKLSTYQALFKTLLHELMSGERRIKNV